MDWNLLVTIAVVAVILGLGIAAKGLGGG